MRDFLQDWRRWTRAERVGAVLIATILLLGVPMALAINVYLTTPGQFGGVGGTF
jgi:hypothetical protein